MKKKTKMNREMTAEEFIALPEVEKNRIFAEIDSMPSGEIRAQSKPLNAREQTEWRRIQKAMRRGRGRPKLGKNGVQKVSVSIEQSLLKRIDSFAKSHDLNRSELFARGAEKLIGVRLSK